MRVIVRESIFFKSLPILLSPVSEFPISLFATAITKLRRAATDLALTPVETFYEIIGQERMALFAMGPNNWLRSLRHPFTMWLSNVLFTVIKRMKAPQVRRIRASFRPTDVMQMMASPVAHGEEIPDRQVNFYFEFMAGNTCLAITVYEQSAEPNPAPSIWIDRNLLSPALGQSAKLNFFIHQPRSWRTLRSRSISLGEAV